MKNQKGKNETFPKIDIEHATNGALLEEYTRAVSGSDNATSAAEMRHYEQYEQELKTEILDRMSRYSLG